MNLVFIIARVKYWRFNDRRLVEISTNPELWNY